MKSLVFALCVTVFLSGCQPDSRPGGTLVHISGDLSSHDLAQIKQRAAEEWAVRPGPDKMLKIKSIAVTTNCLYGSYKRIRDEFKVAASTNRQMEYVVQVMEDRLKSLTPRPAVEVWYADSRARWGEAGYLLEKETNNWKIASTLGR